jgi:hypothetical protein
MIITYSFALFKKIKFIAKIYNKQDQFLYMFYSGIYYYNFLS